MSMTCLAMAVLLVFFCLDLIRHLENSRYHHLKSRSVLQPKGIPLEVSFFCLLYRQRLPRSALDDAMSKERGLAFASSRTTLCYRLAQAVVLLSLYF